MRQVRGAAGVSLRELESRGAWRRSTISQVENGKARPSRQLIEWYESELGSDGLLLSIYAEARSRQVLGRVAVGKCASAGDPGDVVQVIDVDPPAGHLVNRRSRLQARLTLRNTGAETWRGHELRRMGAYAGTRLIGSAPRTAVPDTAPGEIVDVVIELQAPELPGSVVAYWDMVHRIGREYPQTSPSVAVVLVVD